MTKRELNALKDLHLDLEAAVRKCITALPDEIPTSIVLAITGSLALIEHRILNRAYRDVYEADGQTDSR